MLFAALTKYGLGSIVIWGVSLALLIIVIIIYIIRSMQMNRNPDLRSIKTLGNTLSGLGIGLSILGIGWIILLISIVTNSHNIGADCSSLYVSRNNLLLNWFNPVTAPKDWPNPTNTKVPISAIPPQDGVAVCFATFQDKNDNGFENYRKLISAYTEKGGKVQQAYYMPPDAAHGNKPFIVTEDDTLENQRALTLAYYRYVYCTQQYMSLIINHQVTDEAFSFLPTETVARLKLNTDGCDTTAPKITDTTFCLDQNWPTKTTKCGAPNPCFAGLVESIGAQCLLYDDLVYKTQHPGVAKGALAAFGVLGSVESGPGLSGYQVWNGQ